LFNLSLERILISIPVVLIAITFHELGHALTAYSFGDQTAKNQGRLSLNPLRHLDPIGALMLLFMGFGWAKPVPVNPYNFRGNRKRSMMVVSAAGPAMNILLALIASLFFYFFYNYLNSITEVFLRTFILINVFLASFNLLPVPPLDGSKILAGLLPDKGANFLYSIEAYGPMILVLLIVTRATSYLVMPIANFLLNLINIIAFAIVF